MRAELLPNGEYITKLKTPPMIGAIKSLLVAPPKDEYWFMVSQEKVRMLQQSIQMAIKKISETDGDEKVEYQQVLKEHSEELKNLQSSRMYLGKPKNLRARIIEHIEKDIYLVEIIDMPKKWKTQLLEITNDVNGEEEIY